MDTLNKNELEALRALWKLGEAKPAQIEAEFSWRIDNGTLRSVLRVLVEKGIVVRRKAGKAYLYAPKNSREGFLVRMARQMSHVFAGGSSADLIAQLIKSEDLSAEDLAELRRIAKAKSPAARNKTEDPS